MVVCHSIFHKLAITYISVVQLLLTYGRFYKNVTIRGPLLIKGCIEQQIHNI